MRDAYTSYAILDDRSMSEVIDVIVALLKNQQKKFKEFVKKKQECSSIPKFPNILGIH